MRSYHVHWCGDESGKRSCKSARCGSIDSTDRTMFALLVLSPSERYVLERLEERQLDHSERQV